MCGNVSLHEVLHTSKRTKHHATLYLSRGNLRTIGSENGVAAMKVTC